MLTLVVMLLGGATAPGEAPEARPSAAEAESHLDAARALYRGLRYRQARERAEAALLEPGADERTLVEAYVLLGSIAAIEGDDDAAQAHFVEVLKRQPRYELAPSTSPKIAIHLERARALVPPLVEAPPPGGEPARSPSPREKEQPPAAPSPAPSPSPSPPPVEAEADGSPWATWAVAGAAAGVATVVVVAGLAAAGAGAYLLLQEPPCQASLGCATAP